MKILVSTSGKTHFSIGVAGYVTGQFDITKAERLLKMGIERMAKYADGAPIEVVSGLTDMGILSLAYEYAAKHGYRTVGIACPKVTEYKQYPVDEKIIVGTDWGDESKTFLNRLDALVRIGAGPQSIAEAKNARVMGIPVIEFELERTS